MADASAGAETLRVRFGEFVLDEANARLLRDGKAIALSPTPFGLLCALARRPGSLMAKHALLDAVWGHRFVSDSVLKGAISEIRTALGDDPRGPRYIETVPRRGYRFIPVPTVLQEPERASDVIEIVQQRALVAPAGTSSARAAEGPLGRSFIGRATMLARLRRAWERASGGTRAIVWIGGEPGIGKTTLIDHFVTGLGKVMCARGQCVQQYGSGEPYHPVLEALADLCRTDAQVPPLLRAVAPTWLLQMPWVSTEEEREVLRRERVGISPERMLREMGEFLDRYTQDRPLLLITEDLHWGDRPTIQLIDFLARRRGRSGLLWLASFRLAEVVATDHPFHAVRHELRLHGLCEEIVLDPFSEAEVGAYLAGRSPVMAEDESMVRALHERTDGVPLFVASLADEISERSALTGADAAALLATSPVPENLLAIIDHYLGKLDNQRRALLTAAAACGMEFGVETLARVLERDVAEVAQECERLSRECIWLAAPRSGIREESQEERGAFRHALFRQVIYDRTGLSARADLHRKVGSALERERADGRAVSAAQLAMHFDRGRVPLAALHYYAEAAERALLHVSPAECLSLTDRAASLLERTPAGVDRTSLEITLVTLRGVAAFHLLGAGDEARNAYQHASSLLTDVPQHPIRGLLLHGFGFLLNLRAEYTEALATADRADAIAAEAGDTFLALAACTARGQACMHQGRPEAARESLEQALPAMAAASAASGQSFIGFIADPQVTVMAMLGLPLAHLGLVRKSRERLQQAYTRAHGLAQPMALLVTMWFDALCEVRFGNVDRVAALAEEMHALVEQFALVQGKTAARWFRGWAQVRQGKPLEGFRQIRAAYEENIALGMIAGSSETLGYAAEALVLQGDWDGADEQLRQAMEIVNTYGERIYLPQLLLTEGAIARARGNLASADASIRCAISEAQAQGALWLELLALTELCARSTATIDDRRTLAALVARLADEHGGVGDTSQLKLARGLIEGVELS